MSVVNNKLSGGQWVRTIRCGCGACSTMANRPADYRCPMEDSRDAIQLWATEYNGDEDEPDTAVEDQVVGEITGAFVEA